MEFLDHPWLIAVVAVLSWPIYTNLAKLFFGDRYEDFSETARHMLRPDIVSLFKGQFWKDWDATMKIKFFLFTCIAWVAAVSELVSRAFF